MEVKPTTDPLWQKLSTTVSLPLKAWGARAVLRAVIKLSRAVFKDSDYRKLQTDTFHKYVDPGQRNDIVSPVDGLTDLFSFVLAPGSSAEPDLQPYQRAMAASLC